LYIYNDPDDDAYFNETSRSHPWSWSESDPANRYVDFRSHPELIEESLEDFKPFSDRSAILQAFARAEKQYPSDYRFPYERAKLAIKESESHSHDEAFSALSLAAEMAINSGKAHEMLDDLKADKGGDFHKLSHGHHEWAHLAEALKSRDTSLLK